MSRRSLRRIPARRRDEHGAVAVLVALLMVPLIGLAAIAVDVASLWAQRQQLQNGADAAALAIANDCLRRSCGTPSQTATALASQNLGTGTSSTATVTARTSTSVTVQNRALQSFVFAPVLGVDASPVTAHGTAVWEVPTGGSAALPLVLSRCEYIHQTNGGSPTSTVSQVLLFSRTSVASCRANGYVGNSPPGGFVWIASDPNRCGTTSVVDADLAASTSNSPPTGCSGSYFASLQNTVVMLPIFTSARSGSTGNSLFVHVSGYAAFRLTGYYLGASISWNAPCSGSERCLRGYFTEVETPSSSFSYGAGPFLGVGRVRLTE